LRILDLCTGPGSIALLLSSLLHGKLAHQIVGVDISKRALSVAEESLKHNVQKGFMNHTPPIRFIHGDVLDPDATLFANINKAFLSLDSVATGARVEQLQRYHRQVDLIISNPPYISPKAIWQDTGRSVRRYEPRIALVPLCKQTNYQENNSIAQEDLFYPQIGYIAQHFHAKGIVVELGDWKQAERVEEIFKRNDLRETATWQDFSGNGRMVVAWNKSIIDGRSNWRWLKKS